MPLARRWARGESQSANQRLDDEIDAFVAWVRPIRGEHEMRLHAFACFEKVVARLWPAAKVELFGSMATGLYLPSGDLDIVILDDLLAAHDTRTLLHTLERALAQSGFASSIRLVPDAKVPLVKLVTAREFGAFAMDVSFNSPNGPRGAVESLRLLGELEATKPGAKARVKALVFLLKALLNVKGLAEVKDGGLGGMGIFCLVVSFVQLDTRQPDECSPGQDLLHFLWKYGFDFDYRRDCIITADGGWIMSKAHFGWSGERLSIQHPLDPDRDLTSGTWAIKSLRRAIEKTYVQLRACIDDVTDTPPARLTTDSLLDPLGIRIPPAVVAQRHANQQMIDTGGLADLAERWVPRMDVVVAAWAREAHLYAQNGRGLNTPGSSLSGASTPSPPQRPPLPAAYSPYMYTSTSSRLQTSPYQPAVYDASPPISPAAAPSPIYQPYPPSHPLQQIVGPPATYASQYQSVFAASQQVMAGTHSPYSPSSPYSPAPYPFASTYSYAAPGYFPYAQTTPSYPPSLVPSTPEQACAHVEPASPQSHLRYYAAPT
ncbi:hypothetical protein JCM10450v2_006543 [Rhodotorula kratochvilovae]